MDTSTRLASIAMIINYLDSSGSSCNLTGAGRNGTVRFTFGSSHTGIDPASVKTS